MCGTFKSSDRMKCRAVHKDVMLAAAASEELRVYLGAQGLGLPLGALAFFPLNIRHPLPILEHNLFATLSS